MAAKSAWPSHQRTAWQPGGSLAGWLAAQHPKVNGVTEANQKRNG